MHENEMVCTREETFDTLVLPKELEKQGHELERAGDNSIITASIAKI
ncbi:unnamed protein product, partial [Microthlaspi erraticum]